MSRIISRAEAWEKTYNAFQTINFTSFDYVTIKQSMVNYIKLYFPEDFNDYIESSEFVAILELFAYLGELISYRLDMNANENFLSTAQRRESVLRLAKLLSYDPSRCLPARGLVKIASISTTQQIYDSNGINLAGRKIYWNDVSNSNWKEQFLLVMNATMNQSFGTVTPNERVQVDDVLFELYSWNNNPLTNNVFSYSTSSISSTAFPMELVPTSLNQYGPLERRPELTSSFSFLYGSDGLGDGSNTTGFFCFTKQGILSRIVTTFDGVTPNQTFTISTQNINDTDVWINNINPVTGEILDDGTVSGSRSGEWQEVDLAHAQNIIYNTNPNRNKYEIETLDNDSIRIIFGDGEFSNIPSGTFEIWTRVSANTSDVVPMSTVVNQPATFTYKYNNNSFQTITFTFSLINTLQNGAPSEDIEHIRSVAPSVYYSQDRMVNGRDYNSFMLQDSSILKLRAVNRTYAGESNYIAWFDPSTTYQNVKMFGDDLALYFEDGTFTQRVTGVTSTQFLLENYIQPLLSATDIFTILSTRGVLPKYIRKSFTSVETASILAQLNTAALSPPETVQLYYSIVDDAWQALPTASIPTITSPLWTTSVGLITVTANSSSSWTITNITEHLIAESQAMMFWNDRTAARITSYDTLNANSDNVVVLKANENATATALLQQNWTFNVIGNELVEPNLTDAGTPDIHRLSLLPVDINGDGVPDFSPPLLDIMSPTNYVYFNRVDSSSDWIPTPTTALVVANYAADVIAYPNETDIHRTWIRRNGVFPLNFAWFHFTSQYHLVDPAPTNIVDIYLITSGYYKAISDWLSGVTQTAPTAPTPLQLRTDYSSMLDNAMISDTVVLHPGSVQVLFGKDAIPQLQASFVIVPSPYTTLTDNQIKVKVVQIIIDFFDINTWEFGQTFYFTKLSTAIQTQMPSDIDSVVLVPTYATNQFGDMFQVQIREDQIAQPSITVDDVQIVPSLTPQILRIGSPT